MSPRAPNPAEHLLCFVLPLLTLAFVAAGPRPWWAALPWLGVSAALVALDDRSGPDARQPAPSLPAWPFAP